MAGRLTGVTVKPLPVTVTELTVTGAVPVEVIVTVCVVALLITMGPNEMLVAFRLKAGVAAFSCKDADCDVLPDAAVNVMVCALVTAETFAVNDALVAVAGTVMDTGTVTALPLLVMETLTPPVGAEPDRLTVQLSARDPVIDVLLQASALTVGVIVVPVPLRLTVVLGALLEIVSCPVDALAVVGSNCTVTTAA